MYSVEERYILPEKVLSHSLICSQHKIFYKFCRRIPVIRLYIDSLAVFIKYHLAFRQVKVYRTSLCPRSSKQIRNFLKIMKQVYIFGISFFSLFIAVCDDFIDRRICHPLIYIDNALTDIVAYYMAFFIYLHNT